MQSLEEFTDADAGLVITRALRLVAIMTAVAFPLIWWKMGGRSAGMLAVGAAVSAAGLWKWLGLMTVVMARMDAGGGNGVARPMGRVMVGFFLTLGLMMVALYGSLKLLDGSVYALAAGLVMGIFALTVEGLKLMKAWTV